MLMWVNREIFQLTLIEQPRTILSSGPVTTVQYGWRGLADGLQALQKHVYHSLVPEKEKEEF